MNVPAHITRFEKLQQKGKWLYLFTTALSVAGVIAAIQWYHNRLSWPSIALYAVMGAAIAYLDWWVLAKRYAAHQRDAQ